MGLFLTLAPLRPLEYPQPMLDRTRPCKRPAIETSETRSLKILAIRIGHRYLFQSQPRCPRNCVSGSLLFYVELIGLKAVSGPSILKQPTIGSMRRVSG